MPDPADGPNSSSIEPPCQLARDSIATSANVSAPSSAGSAAAKLDAEIELEKEGAIAEDVDVEAGEEKSPETPEEESDPNIVWWDGPDDPQVRIIAPMKHSTPLIDNALESHELVVRKEVGYFVDSILTYSPHAAWIIHVRARRTASHTGFPHPIGNIGHFRRINLYSGIRVWPNARRAGERDVWQNASLSCWKSPLPRFHGWYSAQQKYGHVDRIPFPSRPCRFDSDHHRRWHNR